MGHTDWRPALPAAITATAYLVIAAVTLPLCRDQARGVLVQLDRITGKASRDFLVLYFSAMVTAALLYSIVNVSAFKTPTSRQEPSFFYVRELVAFTEVSALGWLLAYLVMAYGYASALRKSAGGQGLSWAQALAATAVTAWLPAVRKSPVGNPRLDSALLCLLSCAVSIDDLGHRECLASARTVRSAIHDLELAAADIEQYAVERVPRSDTLTRRLALQDGMKLASAIRDAKAPLARALYPRLHGCSRSLGRLPADMGASRTEYSRHDHQ